MKSAKIKKYLSLFLWLVAIHSFLVGVGLILLPSSLIDFFGYETCAERLFPSQGGVFHIAMAVGYAMAAFNISRFECLIVFFRNSKIYRYIIN